MLEKRIKLNGLNDRIEFLNIANSLSCDVDIRYGGLMFDAKSFFSVMSLDNSNRESIRVRVHTKDTNVINKFEKWFI